MHWVLNFKVHETCIGTKKHTFELQSAPNLHRDKKTKVLNFKVHQTRRGTKQQKFWTSKCTKPAEGQKKQKNKKGNKSFTFYLRRGDYIPLKFLFVLFFVSVQVWCTLKFKIFVFCPCAGLEHFKLKPLLFLCLWRFWLIRKSPIKALDKEKEELRVMRAVFKKGEWIKEGRVLLKGRI